MTHSYGALWEFMEVMACEFEVVSEMVLAD